MFRGWKKKYQNGIEIEILLEQLHVLATDTMQGRAKKVDYVFWKEKLNDLKQLCADDNRALKGAIDAYSLIFEHYKSQLFPEGIDSIVE